MARHLLASPEAVQGLNRQLLDLLSRAEAACALLVDESGALVAKQGRIPGGDPEETATLIACNFLVTLEMAAYLGESEISVLLHEGDLRNFYLRRVGHRGILAVLFEDPGALGRVRVFVDRAAAGLEPALAALEHDAVPAGSLPDGFQGAARAVIDVTLRPPAGAGSR